jgi:hypothetical protein
MVRTVEGDKWKEDKDKALDHSQGIKIGVRARVGKAQEKGLTDMTKVWIT